MNSNPLKTNEDKAEALSAMAEFIRRIDEIFGLYLDATQGFNCNLWRLNYGHEEAKKKGIPVDSTDDAKFFFGKGNPNDPKNVLLHTTTLGEYKRRNSRGGSNHILFGQYFVVLFFHLWDGEYRPRIANALGLPDPNTLKLPICGDLRLLRNDILKHRGVITKEKQTKLETLKHIPANQLLVLSSDDIEGIVSSLKKAVDDLAVSHAGVDPKHRTIWHVQ
jgi:hypothetical protein